MGKRFEYDFTAHPNEASTFAKRMNKAGMKQVKHADNKVTFLDPRPLFGKSKRR